MFFPNVTPSRDQCFADVAAALVNQAGRIYLDASVLIHCYEMSAAARDELLSALESWGGRVFVPTWAARETWEYTNNRIARRPLEASAARTKKELLRFQNEALRYVDDDTLKDLAKSKYQEQLDEAIEAVTKLIDKVSGHEPKADATTAKLMPFIETRRLKSDLTAIFETVALTGDMRHEHTIPPGFADAALAKREDGRDEDTPAKIKGKQKNAHGDLIIWLEILENCRGSSAEQLVVITKDTTKGDWAYEPKKILDDKGRPQNNDGLVTLPLPLLMHEAVQTCPTLLGVHIVSVEMLTHVLQKVMKVAVGNLAAALQAGEDDQSGQPPPIAEAADAVTAEPGTRAPLSFSSSDMSYDYPHGDDIDNLIQALNVEGWKAQNAAVRQLKPVLARATRDQRVQIGRGLVVAANDNATQSVEFLRRLLNDDTVSADIRGDVLIGVMAAIYIAETGEPKKPEASMALTELIFDFETIPHLAVAYDAVLERLKAQRRKYLALPKDHPTTIPLDMALEGAQLRGASVAGYRLLEEDAPPTRLMHRSGRDLTMTAEELVAEIATQFAVPAKLLATDLAQSFQIVVPTHLGYVSWGPTTGTILR